MLLVSIKSPPRVLREASSGAAVATQAERKEGRGCWKLWQEAMLGWVQAIRESLTDSHVFEKLLGKQRGMTFRGNLSLISSHYLLSCELLWAQPTRHI